MCKLSGPNKPILKVEKDQEKTLEDTIMSNFDLDYIMGKFDPAKHPDFAQIPMKYADQAGRLMRKDALAAFLKMAIAAEKDGISLIIKSSTRNFNYQKGIWERKWKGETILDDGTKASDIADPKARALKILEYSSMPGTSRHHWGTDIDINDFNNAYFEKEEGKKVYDWLSLHARSFGFCQVYSKKGPLRSNGYNEEKWHWSYLPVANNILKSAIKNMRNELISGFEGANQAAEIDMINNYMLAISSECKS